MSLFGTKKKIYVSSTVYKVIDDGTDRADFLREVIAGTALSTNANASMAEAIQAGINRGPRSNQRAFFRWAKNNFDLGMPRAAINYTEVIDDVAVAAEIKSSVYASDPAKTINIISSFIDNNDEMYLAEQWLYANRAEIAHVDWAADYNSATGNIDIQYPGGTMYLGNPIFTDSFAAPGFNTSDTVLIAYYTVTEASTDSPPRAFVYTIGSGNAALDNRVVELSDGSAEREFYPFIPLRIDNKSVFDAGSPAQPHQALIEKAWDKALGSDIHDALAEINSNPDIGDIDYAYLVFGVCLNTSDKAEKAYIYEFFKLLSDNSTIPAGSFQSTVNTNDGLGYHIQTINDMVQVNSRPTVDAVTGFITGTDTATMAQNPQRKNIYMQIPSSTFGVLDMKISWSELVEQRVTGLAKAGAKVGDVFIEHTNNYGNDLSFEFLSQSVVRSSNTPGLRIRKQVNSQEYIEILVQGLEHKNLIYSGKSVDITAAEAMADSDDSGFIIPLHEPTLKRLGGIKATDVARESYLMVFNSYQVVKKKWYQSGIFSFILAVIVIVVVAVVTVVTAGAGTPAAAAAGAGVLGSAAAVGAALGFSGLLAIAVGAAANAIAAMLILQLISVGATELFGERIGQLLTIVSAIVLTLGTGPGGFNLNNVTSNLANLTQIDKLVLLTNAAADVVQIYQQDQLEGILEDIQDLQEEGDAELERIADLMKEMGFDDSQIIDPLMLTDFTLPGGLLGEGWVRPLHFAETPDAFLQRTLMVGSDLIDISNSAITNFTDASLTLT